MSKIKRLMESFYSNISLNEKVSFISVIICGLICHGYILFNKLLYHDGLILYGFGLNFSIGRWMLGVAERVINAISSVQVIPYLYCLLSIILIAISSMLVVKILKVKKSSSGIIIGVLMIILPVVTSTFAYMFTAPFYFLALLLSVFSVYIISEKITILRVILSSILIAISLGIYQAYFAVVLCLEIMILFNKVYNDSKVKFIKHIKNGIYFVCTAVMGMMEYLVINKLFVKLLNIDLTSYQGFNNLGKLELKKIPVSILKAFNDFFNFNWSHLNDGFISYIVMVLFIILAILIIISVVNNKTNITNRLLMIVLMIIFPLAVNIVYLFSTSDGYNVHSVMRYASVFVFIFPIPVLEDYKAKNFKTIYDILGGIVIILYLITSICYIYIDNIAYFRMSTLVEQTNLYFNSLITQIKSIDNYDDDLPITYINEYEKQDKNLFELPEYNVKLAGDEFTLNTLINNYAWQEYVKLHNGFAPNVVDNKPYINKKEVKNMPCYPDDGSIKIVDKTIVVKFND